MSHIWDKNSGKDATDRSWFEKFTTEEDRICDAHLIPYDIAGNLAQAVMLHQSGILTDEELGSMQNALRALYREWEQGEFGIGDQDEDVHSAVEKKLVERIGDTGKKIHTGRSRNDQVQTDIRLFAKDFILQNAAGLMQVFGALDEIRSRAPQCFFAGLTHTQPAMPTSVDAWVAGYQDLILSDLRTLMHVYSEFDRSPMGSAAGYGTPHFSPNRELVAVLLGFGGVQVPATSVQLQRGVLEKKLTDALASAALCLNRMASDVILFAHPAFGFVRLSEDQTSGSSIMPQKRNPDAWELIRGGYSWFAGYSAQLGTVGAGLVSGYHRDLQITKKVLMDALFRMLALSDAALHCISGLEFDADACRRSLTAEVFATHEANRLVASGIPFRDAYRMAAESVQQSRVLDDEELAASYQLPGHPGRYPGAWFAPQKQTIEKWISEQTRKKDAILQKLVRDAKS